MELHVCDVCKALDNDYTLKECRYCDNCKAWICLNDEYHTIRRGLAMLHTRFGKRSKEIYDALDKYHKEHPNDNSN